MLYLRENIKPVLDGGYMIEAGPPALGRLGEIQAPTLVGGGDLVMPGIHEIAGRIETGSPRREENRQKGPRRIHSTWRNRGRLRSW